MTYGWLLGVYSVFITSVAIGQAYKCQQSLPNLRGPPIGFDSVWATMGQDLNWDEVVVYNDKAARPLALILYTL